MAFAKLQDVRQRRRLLLFALMDMFFILLLFYLAIVQIDIARESAVSTLYATPAREYGRAQILVQMVNADSIIWLDNSSFRGEDWRRDFPNRFQLSIGDLPERVRVFNEILGPCIGNDVYVVIQCPDWLSYVDVMQLQTRLKEVADESMNGRNLQYALLPGSVDDLRVSHIEYDRNGDVLVRFPSAGD